MESIDLDILKKTGKYTFISKDEIRDRVKISEMDQILYKMAPSQRHKTLSKTRLFF